MVAFDDSAVSTTSIGEVMAVAPLLVTVMVADQTPVLRLTPKPVWVTLTWLLTLTKFTVRLALAVFPVPALVEVTCTLLFFTPVEAPVTLTETVHEPEFSVAPDKLTVPEPAVAVAVPPQPL